MEDQSSLFCRSGEPSIFVWGSALQIQPPSWSLSHRFSSQMLSSCVLILAALHPSSHRTGLPQRISRFRKKREEDLRKKNWSNQYENPRSAHQSGFEHEDKGDFATSPKHFSTTTTKLAELHLFVDFEIETRLAIGLAVVLG
ncbi:hypothetical protein ACE6H2_014187 [Prunus campanulata]